MSGNLLQAGHLLTPTSRKSLYRQCLPHRQVHRLVAVVCRPTTARRDTRYMRRADLSQQTMCHSLRAVIVSERLTLTIQERRHTSHPLFLDGPPVFEIRKRLQARSMNNLGALCRNQIPVEHEAAVHDDPATPAHHNDRQRNRASSNERIPQSLETRAKVHRRRILSGLIIRHLRRSLLPAHQWIPD